MNLKKKFGEFFTKIFKFFQIFSEGAGWLTKKLIFFKMVRYDDLLELVS